MPKIPENPEGCLYYDHEEKKVLLAALSMLECSRPDLAPVCLEFYERMGEKPVKRDS